MSHLPFTISAYFFNALAVLANKHLLNRAIPDPLVYIFYISLVSLPAIFALPFVKIPDFETFILASLSTITWTMGAYFMFKALKLGQVSRVIPVIGTLIPLILLMLAVRSEALSITQIEAVIILTFGLVFLTATDWKGKLNKEEIICEVLSASLFAISYVILRSAYLKLDFLSVLVWSRMVLLPLLLIMVAIPFLRIKVISSKGLKINFLSKEGFIFLGGQLSGALSEVLILFSISLANPALVNSLQGSQYVFLLIFDRKKYPFLILLSKVAGIIFIAAGLYLLAFS
ncbi:hypothetical protein HYS95_02490 [Candidatus Daviesbacteria bacterium]|nr:hypothetical protein [Candidatus Daviesbacteria bacterium]